MREKDLRKLKAGDFIQHKHYGLCVVHEAHFTPFGVYFGLAIRPLSIEGYMRLAIPSGTLFNRLMEDSKRLILAKVEDPEIPKLIIKTQDGFEVHSWDILGEVSSEGVFSSKKLKVFKDIEAAKLFAEHKKNPD